MYPPEFLELCIKTMKDGPQEISINSLLHEFQLTSSALSSISLFEEGFIQYGLEVFPPFKEGSLDQPRTLKVKQISTTFSVEDLKKIIDEGENHQSEFKSTLLLDVRRKRNDPKASLADLKSEEVINSAFKTIAGFLNWEGGKLLIGVEDNGVCFGIENDFCFFNESQRNLDGWELEFRNQVRGKFHDGNAVNQHINVKFCNADNVLVAVIEVFPRRKLSFLRKSSQSDYVLYSRLGNSTVQIPLIDFEEFLERRKQSLGF